MGVSKTGRAGSIPTKNPPPEKGDHGFRKALKSASEKQGAAIRSERPLEPAELDPLKLDAELKPKKSELQSTETIEPDADNPMDLDHPEAGLSELSGEAFSEDEILFEDDVIMADALWVLPGESALPGATIAAPAPTLAPTAPPAEVMQHLVSAMAAEGWVGADIHGRKVVMLNVQCPGRGSVRIRLKKEDEGVSVRVRADNDELSSLLVSHQGELRDSMAKKGLALASLEVVN